MKLDDNNITKVVLKDKSVHYIVKLSKDELIYIQKLVKNDLDRMKK